MNIAQKKEAWRLLGDGIDAAAADGVPVEEFLTRAALLFALELPDIGRMAELIRMATEAGKASGGEYADVRAELARAW